MINIGINRSFNVITKKEITIKFPSNVDLAKSTTHLEDK